MNEMKESFKAWLEHPCTKLYQKVLKNRRDDLFKEAGEIAYHSYHENEKNPATTLYYGKIDGLDVALGALDDCQEQLRQERLKGESEDYSIENFLEESADVR